jgi:hypothetical protein
MIQKKENVMEHVFRKQKNCLRVCYLKVLIVVQFKWQTTQTKLKWNQGNNKSVIVEYVTSARILRVFFKKKMVKWFLTVRGVAGWRNCIARAALTER